MAKVKDLHSEMAHARKSDGLNVIFDRNSPASSRSRSPSRSSSSSPSIRGRGSYRQRCRSSSSSSRSSNSRSRSHPRCHRRFSGCRCETHSRKSHRRHRRSPSRRHKARHHSDSCSPSPSRSPQRRNYRSRSRSSQRERRHKREEGRTERRASRSPSRTDGSPSQSSPRSTGLSLDDKKELLQAAKANAMKMFGSDTLKLPESVKQMSPEQSRPAWEGPEELQTRVRQGPKKSPSQSDDSEPEDMPSPKIAPQRKTITFSINNSVAKPTAAASSSSRITARADSYESRKPYGHWMPVKSGRKRKHTLAVSR